MRRMLPVLGFSMTVSFAPLAVAQDAGRIQSTTAAIAGAADNAGRRVAVLQALGASGISYALEPFGDSAEATGTNIVVTLPGTSDETILIAAHYDRVDKGSGAVDNASSCAVLIELLRKLRGGPRTRATVRGVFFDVEETQLVGSRAYFEKHRHDLPVLGINLDIFGYGTALYATASDLDGLAARHLVEAARAGGIAEHLVPLSRYPNSDHRSMVAAGIETVGLALVDPEEPELLVNPQTARTAKIASIIHSAADTMAQVRCEQVARAVPVVERFIRLAAE